MFPLRHTGLIRVFRRGAGAGPLRNWAEGAGLGLWALRNHAEGTGLGVRALRFCVEGAGLWLWALRFCVEGVRGASGRWRFSSRVRRCRRSAVVSRRGRDGTGEGAAVLCRGLGRGPRPARPRRDFEAGWAEVVPLGGIWQRRGGGSHPSAGFGSVAGTASVPSARFRSGAAPPPAPTHNVESECSTRPLGYDRATNDEGVLCLSTSARTTRRA